MAYGLSCTQACTQEWKGKIIFSSVGDKNEHDMMVENVILVTFTFMCNLNSGMWVGFLMFWLYACFIYTGLC